MKRIIYTMALGAIMAAPFMLTPVVSRAGDGDTYYNQIHQERQDPVSEWFHSRDVGGREEWLRRGLRDPFGSRPVLGPGRPGMPGNSVPLNEGTWFLLLAGLGLGVKVLYDQRRKGAVIY